MVMVLAPVKRAPVKASGAGHGDSKGLADEPAAEPALPAEPAEAREEG